MITYLYWWYLEEPAYIWRAIRIVTKKVFFSFSVPLLLRTLFDPWRRDVTYKENASLQDLFNIWIGNLISRLVGFILRLVTIFTGIFLTIIVFLILIFLYAAWLLMPAIIVFLFYTGIRNFLNG